VQNWKKHLLEKQQQQQSLTATPMIEKKQKLILS
jgi:hypothetical protein